MGSPQPVTIKFDPQSYLLSYYNDSNNTMRNDMLSTQPDSFNYVKHLDSTTNTPFPQCVSILNGNSNNNNLIAKPIRKKIEQYFRPNIKLYRISYDSDGKPKQRRFFFDGTQNAAIKSCEITLAGSNPVTAEKQIEFKIVFSFYGLSAFCGNASKTVPNYSSTNLNEADAFQNIYDAWIASNDVENPMFAENGLNWKTETGELITKNYWSLIFHPSINNLNNNQAGGRTTYNTQNFRIKAEVGRLINEDGLRDLTRSIFSNDGLGIYGKNDGDKQRFIDDLRDFITFDSKSYFLNLVRHEFKLEPTVSNKGKVNIELTAEYIAEFESTTHNYDYNILGDLSERLDSIKNDTIGGLRTNQVEGGNDTDSQLDLTDQLSDQLGISSEDAGEAASNISDYKVKDFENYNKVTKLILNSTNPQETTKCLNALGITDTTVIDKYIKLSNSEQQKSKLLDTIDELNKQVNELVSAETIRVKNRYYSNFIKTLLSENGKYFSVTVSQNDKDEWQKWANKSGPKPSWPKANLGTQNPTNKDKFLNELEDAQKNSNSSEQTSNALDELRKQYSTAILETSDATNIDIVFVTFGHFIDSAYKSIEALLLDSNSYKSLTDAERRKRINILKKHKTILSNLSGEYPILNLDSNTTVEGTNLASLPIDLNLIKVFLIDFIIKPQKTIYSLYAFLKDATSVLAINSLNMNTVYNGEINNSADASLASSIINLGVINSEDPDPLDQFGGSKINANQLKFDSLISNYVNSSIKHSNFYNYYLMYDKNLKDFGGTGKIEDDFKKGVIHLNPNQSDSFTKKATFKRIDQPYQKEAKAVGQKTFFLGQFRDFYNCDLDIVGTNYFFPGMIVYTIPFIEAPKEFSNITGIGGYYTVIKTTSTIVPQDSSWETKLETIWHSNTNRESLSKDVSNNECVNTINEFNGTDFAGFANTLNQLSNNLFSEIEEAEKNEEEARSREEDRIELVDARLAAF